MKVFYQTCLLRNHCVIEEVNAGTSDVVKRIICNKMEGNRMMIRNIKEIFLILHNLGNGERVHISENKN